MDFFEDELPVKKKQEPKQPVNLPAPEAKPQEEKKNTVPEFGSKDSSKNLRDNIKHQPLKKESINESAGRRPWEAQPIKTGVDQDEVFDEEILSDDFEADQKAKQKISSPSPIKQQDPKTKPSFKSNVEKQQSTPE